MRTIRGVVRLPDDAPSAVAGLVLVEVRDVSLADAPSIVVAACRSDAVAIEPGATIPFAIEAPEAEPGHRLALRAHVSLDGSEMVSRGDAITTTHLPVPPEGDADGIEAPVRVI